MSESERELRRHGRWGDRTACNVRRLVVPLDVRDDLVEASEHTCQGCADRGGSGVRDHGSLGHLDLLLLLPLLPELLLLPLRLLRALLDGPGEE